MRVGTRASPLSLVQAQKFADTFGEVCKIFPMSTQGDQLQDRCLKDIGGKALFSDSLHQALLAHKIDVAVHSLKDLETCLPEGIEIGCVFDQEEREDVLILHPSLKELPENALVGTCSPRRQALLKYYYPHVRITLFRGNVETRLQKLLNHQVDATLLSLAGLKRLSLWKDECIFFNKKIIPAHQLSLEKFPCAVGQGFLAVTCRSEDKALFEKFNDHHEIAFKERELLKSIQGDCYTVLGVNFSNSSLKACYAPSLSHQLCWMEDKDVQSLGFSLTHSII